MQQWYKFTITKRAAWVSMYINISITAKGAEISGLDSWEDVLSIEIKLRKSIKVKQFILAIHLTPELIDAFSGSLPAVGAGVGGHHAGGYAARGSVGRGLCSCHGPG